MRIVRIQIVRMCIVRMAVWECHCQNGSLRMHEMVILYSNFYSENVHYESGSVRMRIMRMHDIKKLEIDHILYIQKCMMLHWITMSSGCSFCFRAKVFWVSRTKSSLTHIHAHTYAQNQHRSPHRHWCWECCNCLVWWQQVIRVLTQFCEAVDRRQRAKKWSPQQAQIRTVPVAHKPDLLVLSNSAPF